MNYRTLSDRELADKANHEIARDAEYGVMTDPLWLELAYRLSRSANIAAEERSRWAREMPLIAPPVS